MTKWMFLGVFGGFLLCFAAPASAQESDRVVDDRVQEVEKREQMAERRKKMIQERMRQNGQGPGKGSRPGPQAASRSSGTTPNSVPCAAPPAR